MNNLKWKFNQTTVDLSNKYQFVVLTMVAIWYHLSCLSLVQAMACCLTALCDTGLDVIYSGFKCWFTMHRILMNTPQCILCGNTVYQWQECCVNEWCLIIHRITWNDFQPLRFIFKFSSFHWKTGCWSIVCEIGLILVKWEARACHQPELLFDWKVLFKGLLVWDTRTNLENL